MKKRGRHKKIRNVENEPKISHFSPRGRPGRPDEMDLEIDEFEALRLADFESKKQKQAALSMGISQQTFSRILKTARGKVSEALVTGKIIRIGKDAVKIRFNPEKTDNNNPAAKLSPKEEKTRPKTFK